MALYFYSCDRNEHQQFNNWPRPQINSGKNDGDKKEENYIFHQNSAQLTKEGGVFGVIIKLNLPCEQGSISLQVSGVLLKYTTNEENPINWTGAATLTGEYLKKNTCDSIVEISGGSCKVPASPAELEFPKRYRKGKKRICVRTNVCEQTLAAL